MGGYRYYKDRIGCSGWEDIDLIKIGLGAVDWIHVAQDRDQWRAAVDTVMNPQLP
jgi:hypothetical protein